MEKQKERLVELLDNATVEMTECYPNGTPAIMYCEKAVSRKVVYQLADHLLANGVVVPPCKVGEDIYNVLPHGVFKRRIFTEKVKGFAISIITDKSIFPIRMIGDNVFLTREEAEQALKGGDSK